MSGHGRVLMSETDQFWEYAKEAMPFSLRCQNRQGQAGLA